MRFWEKKTLVNGALKQDFCLPISKYDLARKKYKEYEKKTKYKD